ncbi:unnamed protein product [Didymodactylos carnosus]|nr:unnamed protein product [Didymodactylos carnosus]CAF4022760.1 unnamed protein product [Didymodactylos carnosus]
MRLLVGFVVVTYAISCAICIPVADENSRILLNPANLQSIWPQLQLLLGGDKLQQLEDQLTTLVLNAIENHAGVQTLAQQMQNLVGQFLPQAALQRIDFEQGARDAMDVILSLLPTVVSILGSFLGKREIGDERLNAQQLLATLPADKIAKLVQAFLNANHDKVTKVLEKIRELLEQFFPQYNGRIDFNSLAGTVFNTLMENIPGLANGLSSFFGIGK